MKFLVLNDAIEFCRTNRCALKNGIFHENTPLNFKFKCLIQN
jgi:hypothetical protein